MSLHPLAQVVPQRVPAQRRPGTADSPQTARTATGLTRSPTAGRALEVQMTHRRPAHPGGDLDLLPADHLPQGPPGRGHCCTRVVAPTAPWPTSALVSDDCQDEVDPTWHTAAVEGAPAAFRGRPLGLAIKVCCRAGWPGTAKWSAASWPAVQRIGQRPAGRERPAGRVRVMPLTWTLPRPAMNLGRVPGEGPGGRSRFRRSQAWRLVRQRLSMCSNFYL
jgi:hypothetical protein